MSTAGLIVSTSEGAEYAPSCGGDRSAGKPVAGGELKGPISR